MKKLRFPVLSLLLFYLATSGLMAQTQATKAYPLIPYPTSLTAKHGSFIINAHTTIISKQAKALKNEIGQFNDLIKAGLGTTLKINQKAGSQKIVFKLDSSISAEEAYRLNIDTHELLIVAKSPTGIFRAIETIRQLLPPDIEEKKLHKYLTLPALSIYDEPAYAWRGLHLDVSRHFFSVDYLKKLIDLLSLYKMNKLHLHLSDDQGWRIEIKGYPKLTQEGAWRTFNGQDSLCMQKAKDNPDFIIDPQHIIHRDGKTLYGGFYTQQQMKDVIAYAAKRHIDIIPEIDMPGHMMAAINSYPFLTCNGQNKWGPTFSTPICPCNDSTFAFARNIFSEVMDIFPSHYIHVGGDEVDRTSWAQSESCKAFMAAHHIQTTAGLQSYFINSMEKFFNQRQRSLIGWDEILEDGISSTAAIMYWRSWVPDAPAKAAIHGNDVIMSPGNPLYFDNEPDQNSVYNVYHFNPIPAGLTSDQAKRIIGAQANTWSERIPSEKRADYMIFPRITALAELLWTNNQGDYDSFQQRLQSNYPRLDLLNVNYRLPDIEGLVEQNVFVDKAILNPVPPLPGLVIRYTTDGSLPDNTSAKLAKPLVITTDQNIRLAAFNTSGHRGDVYNLHYTREAMAPAVNNTNVSAGLSCAYYGHFYKSTTLISGSPDTVCVVNNIEVPTMQKAPSFGLKYNGFIDVPQDGVYSFYLTCDDGGILQIAGKTVVDNDGLHAPIEKSGQVALQKGLQPFVLNFIEGGGGYTLKLKYSFNGSAPQDIPSAWLKH
ncbi:MAG: family 20 glycosylhydrolase [Mucilaginibacter sp.]